MFVGSRVFDLDARASLLLRSCSNKPPKDNAMNMVSFSSLKSDVIYESMKQLNKKKRVKMTMQVPHFSTGKWVENRDCWLDCNGQF